MSETRTGKDISVDEVEAIVAEEGYEVSVESDNVLKVRDTDSGITLRAVLEENVLFLAVSCTVVADSAISSGLMRKMLDAGNGISTSSFQLYARDGGQVAVTLNNFCKLQAMGEDDRDDILSCLEFLVVDAMAARALLSDLAA